MHYIVRNLWYGDGPGLEHSEETKSGIAMNQVMYHFAKKIYCVIRFFLIN